MLPNPIYSKTRPLPSSQGLIEAAINRLKPITQGSDVHRRLVLWTCEIAERVLRLYEQKYPGNVHPRQAIAAARAWAKEPTEKNRDAAWAVGNAARAAGHAAWAVGNAARAAGHATRAAGNAALAAGDAAEAAVDAALAAGYATEAAVDAAEAAENAALASRDAAWATWDAAREAEFKWQLARLYELVPESRPGFAQNPVFPKKRYPRYPMFNIGQRVYINTEDVHGVVVNFKPWQEVYTLEPPEGTVYAYLVKTEGIPYLARWVLDSALEKPRFESNPIYPKQRFPHKFKPGDTAKVYAGLYKGQYVRISSVGITKDRSVYYWAITPGGRKTYFHEYALTPLWGEKNPVYPKNRYGFRHIRFKYDAGERVLILAPPQASIWSGHIGTITDRRIIGGDPVYEVTFTRGMESPREFFSERSLSESTRFSPNPVYPKRRFPDAKFQIGQHVYFSRYDMFAIVKDIAKPEDLNIQTALWPPRSYAYKLKTPVDEVWVPDITLEPCKPGESYEENPVYPKKRFGTKLEEILNRLRLGSIEPYVNYDEVKLNAEEILREIRGGREDEVYHWLGRLMGSMKKAYHSVAAMTPQARQDYQTIWQAYIRLWPKFRPRYRRMFRGRRIGRTPFERMVDESFENNPIYEKTRLPNPKFKVGDVVRTKVNLYSLPASTTVTVQKVRWDTPGPARLDLGEPRYWYFVRHTSSLKSCSLAEEELDLISRVDESFGNNPGSPRRWGAWPGEDPPLGEVVIDSHPKSYTHGKTAILIEKRNTPQGRMFLLRFPEGEKSWRTPLQIRRMPLLGFKPTEGEKK